MADKFTNQDVKLLKSKLDIAQRWGVSIADIISYLRKNTKINVPYEDIDAASIAASPDVEAWLYVITILTFGSIAKKIRTYVVQTYGTIGFQATSLIAKIGELEEEFAWQQVNAGNKRFKSVLDDIDCSIPGTATFEKILAK
jgi:hypothetical protein